MDTHSGYVCVACGGYLKESVAAGIERRKGMSDYEFIIKIQNLLISKEACVIDTGSYRDVNAVIIPRLEKKIKRHPLLWKWFFMVA